MERTTTVTSALVLLAAVLFGAVPALGEGLVFSVEVVKDTALVYEEISLRLSLRNDGDEPFVIERNSTGPDCEIARITDVRNNKEIGAGGVQLNRVRRTDERVYLEAREEILWVDEVLIWAATTYEGPLNPLRFLPASDYEVILEWSYQRDPRGGDPATARMVLQDTVTFSVVPATGRDEKALKEFLDVRRTCSESSLQACAEAYLELSENYPGTVYATYALSRVIDLANNDQVNLPGFDIASALTTFILARPDDFRCRNYVPYALSLLDENARQQFLRELTEIAPVSYAGRQARTAVSNENNRE